MPSNDTENKGLKDLDRRRAAKEPAKAKSGKAPSVKRQADKVMPKKKPKSARSVYHKGEGGSAAPKTAAKKAPKAAKPASQVAAIKADERKLADEKSAAAKIAAATAREQAKEKREAVKGAGTPGSIYAAALAAGAIAPEVGEDRAGGSIFAAALAEETVIIREDEADALIIEETEVTEVVAQSGGGEDLAQMAGLLEASHAPASAPTGTGDIPVFTRASDKEKKKRKNRPAGKGARLSFPANRGEGGNALFRAVGGGLYALGFYTECKVLMAGRFIRDLSIYIGQILAWVLGGFFRSIGRLIASIARDFTAPFRKAGYEMSHRRGGSGSGGELANAPGGEMVVYTPTAAQRRKHATRNVLGVVMPVAALVALVFVVYSIFGMQYGLAVTVDGRTIGYITDRSVLDDAKSMIRNRLRLTADQSMEEFSFEPVLKVAKASQFTSNVDLANTVLWDEGITKDANVTTGVLLEVDSDMVAVPPDQGQELYDYLQAKKDAYRSEDDPEGVQVDFVNEVVCEPDRADAVLAETVQDVDELKQTLDSTVTEETPYTARGEENLQNIAADHGIAIEALRTANPAIATEGDDFVPGAGTELTIVKDRPYLQVKKTVREVRMETIPYESIEQETEDYTRGTSFVTQTGAEGSREAYYDLTYIDGELVSETLVNELTVVHAEPVNEVIMVGTAEPVVITNSTVANNFTNVGSGSYFFPVPDWIYSSRGMSSGHRGRDINAVHGAPILACESGVVIEAGWHYSWGYNVKIQHADGYTSLYAHASALYVTTGQVVSRGQHIAAIGSTGFSFGDHLHLEIWAPGGGLCDPDNFVYPEGGWR